MGLLHELREFFEMSSEFGRIRRLKWMIHVLVALTFLCWSHLKTTNGQGWVCGLLLNLMSLGASTQDFEINISKEVFEASRSTTSCHRSFQWNLFGRLDFIVVSTAYHPSGNALDHSEISGLPNHIWALFGNIVCVHFNYVLFKWYFLHLCIVSWLLVQQSIDLTVLHDDFVFECPSLQVVSKCREVFHFFSFVHVAHTQRHFITCIVYMKMNDIYRFEINHLCPDFNCSSCNVSILFVENQIMKQNFCSQRAIDNIWNVSSVLVDVDLVIGNLNLRFDFIG